MPKVHDIEKALLYYPSKIRVCTCKQCKGKKKNSRNKKLIKRLANKSIRNSLGKIINFYWA